MMSNTTVPWEQAISKLMPYLRLRFANLDELPIFSQYDVPGLLNSRNIESLSEYLISMEIDPSLPFCKYLVIDGETKMDFVSTDHLQDWGVDIGTAWNTAYANLRKHPNTLKLSVMRDVAGSIVACSYNTMDGYDATRLLLKQVCKVICKGLKADRCLVGIPNRDFLIAFIYRKDVVNSIIPKIREDFQTKDHPLSDSLFIITPKGIATNEDGSVDIRPTQLR